jgi:hypothetical protein
VQVEWPAAEFIVGNPPFLGANKFKRKIENADALREVFDGRVPPTADLVCYWFEKVSSQFRSGLASRFGLLATSAIRAGNNLKFLDRIWSSLNVVEAWDDLPWLIDGASVRVSIICGGQGQKLRLNGNAVGQINSDLTAFTFGGFAQARPLAENANTAFQGSKKVGSFEIAGNVARDMLALPANPNLKSNSEVVKRSWLSTDFMSRDRDAWIVDFGTSMTEREASLYERPFEYVVEHVKKKRIKNARESRSANWWRHGDPQPKMRTAVAHLSRYIVTPEVHTLRVFVWAHRSVLSDCKIMVIARDDDCTFGILSSNYHGQWAIFNGGERGAGRTYTPSTAFGTFPFPEGLTPNIPAEDYENDPGAQAIGKAARRLDELRNAWLNPSDLVRIEPEVVPGYPDRILPKDAEAAVTLRTRTLTNLYNQRPQWLADAHCDLDAAVAAAYGWPADISEEDALAKLLEMNLARSAATGTAEVAESEDDDD